LIAVEIYKDEVNRAAADIKRWISLARGLSEEEGVWQKQPGFCFGKTSGASHPVDETPQVEQAGLISSGSRLISAPMHNCVGVFLFATSLTSGAWFVC